MLIACGAAHGASFTEIDGLPASNGLPAHPSSNALGISGDGLTVVGYSDPYRTGGNKRGIRWTLAAGTVLRNCSGGGWCEANDASYDGAITVGTWSSFATWQANGQTLNLGVLPGYTTSRANAVSADGSVVIGYSGDLDTMAFRWTSATGMLSLGVLPNHTRSLARDISSDGNTIVGLSNNYNDNQASFDFFAFRWTAGTGMVPLATPAGGDSDAYAVSANGHYVAGYIRHDIDGDGAFITEMARWTGTDTYELLGWLGNSGQAYAISADGSVIVGEKSGLGGGAFVWTESLGVQLLADVLAANGIYSTSVSLRVATGIADDNKTIVGWGVDAGVPRGWVVTLDTLAALKVLDLDVLPGDPANVIRPGTTDAVPVAILGKSIASGDTINFDVANIDTASLGFGAGKVAHTGTPVIGDVDGDTVPDLQIVFQAQSSGILCGDTDVEVSGAATGGGFVAVGAIATTDCGWPHPDLVDNDTFTTDTATGLDWLDLTATSDMTMVEAQAANPGWRLPTGSEVSTLFWKLFPGYFNGGPCASGDSGCWGFSFSSQPNDVTSFFALFGELYNDGCDWGVHSLALFRNEADEIRVIGPLDLCTGNGGSGFLYGYDNTWDASRYYATTADSSFGTWLVRSAAAAVDIQLGSWWIPGNEIDPATNNPIHMAVLGKKIAAGDAIDFDATQINPASVRFGAGQAIYYGVPLIHDVDSDSNLDMMLTFRTQDSGIVCGDVEVAVTGETLTGLAFAGTGDIATVNCDASCHP